MSEQIGLRFDARDVDDAQTQARSWARAEPSLILRTIAGVKWLCQEKPHADGHLHPCMVTIAIAFKNAPDPVSPGQAEMGL